MDVPRSPLSAGEPSQDAESAVAVAILKISVK